MTAVALSKLEVGECLIVMQRFDRFIDVDQIAVNSWHALLEDEIESVDVLRQSILDVFRSETSRVTPAHIIARAREISEENAYRAEEQANMLESKRSRLAELGYTVEQYDGDASVREKVAAEILRAERQAQIETYGGHSNRSALEARS